MPLIPATSVLQAPDDVRRCAAAFVARLEVDEEAACIQRSVAAVHTDERRKAVHVCILQHRVGELLLQLRHRAVGGGRRGIRNPLDQPGVLNRKKAFRDHDVEERGEDDGDGRDQQRQDLAVEHIIEPAPVALHDAVREARGRPCEAPFFALRLMMQQPCTQHRHQGQRHHGRDHDRHGERDGELMEQPSHHIAHEEQRDQAPRAATR